MSFPPYDIYRDSRVGWVDRLPAHWREGHLRWLARRYAGGTPDRARLDYWEDGTIPWLNSGSVNQNLISEPSAFITEAALANSSARWVPKGSLVMALAGQGKTKGIVAQLGIASTCNQSMAAIVPSCEVEARYLLWWLAANYQNIRNMAGGDLRDGLNLEMLGDIACPLPDACEQSAIAAFLDCETAKIDALLKEQGRLVELLTEKRQAIISRAVTKGLDSSAPMTASGIGWIGDVPAHWAIRPLKRLASLAGRIGYRGYTTADIVGPGEGAVSMSPSNLSEGEVSLEKCTFITWEKYEESPEIKVCRDDIIFVKTGSTFGKVGFLKGDPPPATINPQLLIIRASGCDPKFLFYALLADHLRGEVAVSNTGGTIPTVTQELIGSLQICVPPLSEQRRIAAAIDVQVARLRELQAQCERVATAISERRAAIISAAVTGKIDVRTSKPNAVAA